MKSYKEILKLLDAGFTRDEILSMEEETPAPAPADPAPAAEQDPSDKLAELIAKMDAKIDRKLNELQAANIYSAQQPEQAQPHVMSDVEALEELIRPHRPENN